MLRTTLAFAILLVTVASLPALGTPAVSGFDETVAASGFNYPTAIAFLPDGRFLVTEEGGDLYIVSGGSPSLLASIPVPDFPCIDYETGLLGVAVDPNFETNGYVYLYRTNDHGNFCEYPPTGWTNEVVRVTIGQGDSLDLGSLVTILPGIRCNTGYHNGGGLRIGPDGKLYISVGEVAEGDFGGGGPGTSTNIYAQDLNALEGKVLRINVPDGTIPSDNPYHNQAGKRGEIWASGFRNPWRFGFDPIAPHRLWLGDVGEDDVEELDIVAKGGNYGWPQCEGDLPSGCPLSGQTAPILTYPHPSSGDPDRAIVGGDFAGNEFGVLSGDYFYADWEIGEIYRVRPNAARTGASGAPTVFVTDGAGPVDVVFGPDGALYYVSIFGGEVHRVALAPGGDQPLSGKKLLLKSGTKKLLQVLSKDHVSLGLAEEDDPTTAGGTLRVSGTGIEDTYELPASGWTRQQVRGVTVGYQYKDPQLVNGPISLVKLTEGKLAKVAGKGTELEHAIGETSPGPVEIQITTGLRRFCMSFGGTEKFLALKSFSATNAPAPLACSDLSSLNAGVGR